MSWLGSQLYKKGYSVTYLNASGVEGFRDGVEFVPVNGDNWHYVGDGKRSIRQSIDFAFLIRPAIKRIQPDVIYSVQAPIFSLFSLAIWPRKHWLLIVEWIEIWSMRYWRSYLGLLPGSIGFLLQSLATRLADIRVVFSSRCLRQLGEDNPDNFLLPGLHMPQEVPQVSEFNPRSDVLFLGRFVAEKQPLLALEAVYELRKLGWKGTFHIVGSGPLASAIQQVIQDKAMSDYVNLAESAPQIELEEYFLSSFVLIHPSKREGYGLAMIEAAERGIPTILIDYPENASVDLQISPGLVSLSEKPTELATLIFEAWDTQESHFTRLMTWSEEVLPTMNAVKSVDQLVSIIDSRYSS
jgi:glycosyltransferase involved in cell wall biosynthesis